MKSYLHSHWFWFSVIFIGYSIYDYAEHISRPDSVFEQYPLDWFLFSLGSVLTIGLGIFLIDHGLKRIKVLNLIAELLAFVVAFWIHLGVSGPLWNHLFWPHDKLYFHLNLSTIGVLLAFYLAYRILFAMVIMLVQRFVLPE